MGLHVLHRQLVDDVLGALRGGVGVGVGLNSVYRLPLTTVTNGLTNLGDVAGSGEAEGDAADGLGHQPHGDLVAAVPHGLDGLADVPVVVSHPDVLRTHTCERSGGFGRGGDEAVGWSHHEGRVVSQRQEAEPQSVEDVDHPYDTTTASRPPQDALRFS